MSRWRHSATRWMPERKTLDEWLEYISGLHPKDMDLGLERVATVAARLGVSKPAPWVVTIAGTNGKGSTTAVLESLLLGTGLAVGATYSPHLNRFNERIRLSGREATDEEICAAFQSVDAVRAEIALTYFEYAALAALQLFAEAGVDVALLEIGLGGRLDAFNLVDADVAVVTSIGLDHEDYLGSDLEGIGREKAGVFRSGRPVVLGAVTNSVHQAASELGCPQYRLGREFDVDRSADRWDYQAADDAAELGSMHLADLPITSLAPDNCALAVTAAALTLAGLGQVVEPEQMAASLAHVRLPGRMESYLLEHTPVLLDVAHNPAAAHFLSRELEARWPERKFVAVYGALADKDVAGVLAELEDKVLSWLLIPTRGWRSQSAEALHTQLPGGFSAEICVSLAAALARARSLTEPGNGILVFGSFSAVEQARELLIDPANTAQTAT